MAKQKYGLIGKNIQYSKSKIIHEMLNTNIEYDILDIPKNQLEDILQDQKYNGFNVTIPYKQEIMNFLDDIDPLAKRIGAVNTIACKNNKLIGYNSDYEGFLQTIKKFNHQFNKALILGSGGACKAVAQVLKDLHIEYSIVSRNPQNKQISYQQAYCDESVDLIINTTPLGDQNHLNMQPIKLDKFDKLKGVIDLVYNPRETPLLKQAKKLNIDFSNGETMLIEQAKKAQAYW